MREWMKLIGSIVAWLLCIVMAQHFVDSNRYVCYGLTLASFAVIVYATYIVILITEKVKP